MTTVTMSTKGQLVIPAEIRERLGLLPGTTFEVVEENNGLRLILAAHGGHGDARTFEGMIKLPATGKTRRLSAFEPTAKPALVGQR